MFQIQDDIIDVTEDEKEAGKTTGNDENKNSFVNLLGLDKALQTRDEMVKKLEIEANKFDSKLSNLFVQIIEKYFKN